MVICYEAAEVDGQLVLRSSRGDVSAWGIGSQLNLLLNQYGNNQEEVDRFCWDLDTTITPIFRHLAPDEAKRLWETHSCKIRVLDEVFDLWYMPSKLLRVSRYRRGSSKQEVASLYFLGQYFPDDIDAPVGLDECVGYAQTLIHKLREKGVTSHRFTSPIALFASDQLDSLHLPRVYFDKERKASVNDTGVPPKALKMAARCGGRLWIEAHQLGLHPYVQHWDLKSAFSKCASLLQDTRQCQWTNCRGVPKDAIFGVGIARKHVPHKLRVSPIIKPRDNEVDINPTGVWEDAFMLPELQWALAHGCKYEILDAWWGIPTRVKLPLNFIYNKMAPMRGESRFHDLLIKRFLNGIYGLTLQTYDNGMLGDYWNSIWGATINATVACHVADTIYKYGVQDCITQIGVDSFSCTKSIEMDKADSLNWKLAHEGEQLVISSGLVYEGEKKPHGWTLPELKAEMTANPDLCRYTKKVSRRMTLGDAMLKGEFMKIGTMIETDASVDLSGKHDRIFEDGGPRTGRELLSKTWRSVPIQIKESNATTKR